MTTSPQIRTALVTLLQSVPLIGQVHAFERYAKKQDDFRDLYVWRENEASTSHVRGWHVRRFSFRRSTYSASLKRVNIEWRIAGFLSVIDAAQSELTMDALIDAVTAKLDADPTLGGVLPPQAQQDGASAGVQLIESRPYMLGGVLCHGVQLGLTTEHLEAEDVESALADLETIHVNWELPPRAEVGPELPDDEAAPATDTLSNLQEEI